MPPKTSKRKPPAYIGTIGLRLRGKSKSPERAFILLPKVENGPVFDHSAFREATNPPKLDFDGLGFMGCLTGAAKKVPSLTHSVAPSLLRKRSRSASLPGCKRPRGGLLSLPTFCGLRGFNPHQRNAKNIFFTRLSH